MPVTRMPVGRPEAERLAIIRRIRVLVQPLSMPPGAAHLTPPRIIQALRRFSPDHLRVLDFEFGIQAPFLLPFHGWSWNHTQNMEPLSRMERQEYLRQLLNGLIRLRNKAATK